MTPLYLHICCAPCGGGCIERLLNRNVTLFYSNSNLCDEDEFNRRLKSVQRLAEYFHLPLIVDTYDHQAWLQAVCGLESEPEQGKRCQKCFQFNLERTAQLCSPSGHFATTLTISPHKSSEQIFAIGSKWEERFEPWNFKKNNGFLIGNQLAKKLGFYRQNFCGCEFSKQNSTANGATQKI